MMMEYDLFGRAGRWALWGCPVYALPSCFRRDFLRCIATKCAALLRPTKSAARFRTSRLRSLGQLYAVGGFGRLQGTMTFAAYLRTFGATSAATPPHVEVSKLVPQPLVMQRTVEVS